MQSLESIIHEAQAVRDMASCDPSPDMRSAVINLSELVVSLAANVKNLNERTRDAIDQTARIGGGACD